MRVFILDYEGEERAKIDYNENGTDFILDFSTEHFRLTKKKIVDSD